MCWVELDARNLKLGCEFDVSALVASGVPEKSHTNLWLGESASRCVTGQPLAAQFRCMLGVEPQQFAL
jgi:hypothetical protein